MFASQGKALLSSHHKACLATDVLPWEPVGGHGTEAVGSLVGSMDRDILPHRACAVVDRNPWPGAICLAEMPGITSDWNLQQRRESLVLLTCLYCLKEWRVALTS